MRSTMADRVLGGAGRYRELCHSMTEKDHFGNNKRSRPSQGMRHHIRDLKARQRAEEIANPRKVRYTPSTGTPKVLSKAPAALGMPDWQSVMIDAEIGRSALDVIRKIQDAGLFGVPVILHVSGTDYPEVILGYDNIKGHSSEQGGYTRIHIHSTDLAPIIIRRA